MLRNIFACFTIDINLDEGEANKAEAAYGSGEEQKGKNRRKEERGIREEMHYIADFGIHSCIAWFVLVCMGHSYRQSHVQRNHIRVFQHQTSHDPHNAAFLASVLEVVLAHVIVTDDAALNEFVFGHRPTHLVVVVVVVATAVYR